MANDLDERFARDVGRPVKVTFGTYEGQYGRVVSRTATEVVIRRNRSFGAEIRVSSDEIKFID